MSKCPVNQLLAMVTTETPHIRSAAIMCLGRVIFEFAATDVVLLTLNEVFCRTILPPPFPPNWMRCRCIHCFVCNGALCDHTRLATRCSHPS